MKKRKIEIPSKDYDIYSFFLPVDVLFGKSRNRFVETELGKRHPCYSDEFCFEQKTSICKDGFKAKVCVMNKVRIAELKAENNSKRLFAKDFKGYVFDSGVFEIWKKYRFVVFMGFFCVLVGIGVFTGNHIFKAKKELEKKEYFEEMDVSKEKLKVEVLNPVDAENFFEIVKTNNGELEWFEWRKEQNFEELKSSVFYIFPEKFMEKNEKYLISSVSYENGKPKMVVSEKNVIKDFVKNENKKINYVFYVPLLRELLMKNNVVVLEEKIDPFVLHIKIKNKNEEINVLEKMGQFCGEKNLKISYALIKPDGQNGFDVQLEFAKDGNNGIDLEIIGKNLNSFVKPVVAKKTVPVAIHKFNAQDGVKIGEVVHGDGKKVEFWKRDGKIIVKEKR